MSLKQYITGKRKGKSAHRLELQAMQDPFLEEALDGYDLVKGDHIKSIDTLQRRVRDRFRLSHSVSIKVWSMVATLLLCISLGGYFLLTDQPDMNNIKRAEVVHSVAMDKMLTDTFTIYQPRDNGWFAATRLAETSHRKKEQQPEKQEELAMPIEFESIQNSRKSDMVVREPSAMVMMDLSLQDEVLPAPVPQQGMPAYRKYLKDYQVHPQDSLCKNVSGTVRLRFFIDDDGTPNRIQVIQSLCGSSDKEAIRLIQHGPKWTTGNVPVEISVSF